MKFIDALREIAAIPSKNPDLLIAQYKAFTFQMPLLYMVLIINTWGLAATHMRVAPVELTIFAPAAMSLISAFRVVGWLRKSKRIVSRDIAFKELSRTNRLASAIAIVFTLWALSLFSYGDAYAKAHVAFYMAITVIGVIFCLMHLRRAAFTVAVIVNGSFVVFFALSGNLVFVAIAVNTAFVSAAMLVILLVHYRDFTGLVNARAENYRLANLDSLSNLPNRRAFFSYLDAAYATATKDNFHIAVGIIDLDGFKPINDLYGHAAGDRLLHVIAQRLLEICPENFFVARLGGDEFAVVATHFGGTDALLAIGEQMCAGIRMPIDLGDIDLQVTGSIGFAVYPELANDTIKLFANADYALYHGKRTGRGKAILFSVEHDNEIRRDARIEQALQHADFTRELAIVFQPIVDVTSQTTVGFEALARWISPTLGPIAPSQFIQVAERSGSIETITQVLLKKALQHAVSWPEELRLSFNLSAQDLSSLDTVMSIISIIGKSDFDPHRLDFEITETAFIRDFQQVRSSTELLRKLGCGISLDDFGTGFSSLTHLHALPLTKIKIDRSFVTNLNDNPASYKIVKSLLALSRDMGLECIVEGVETNEELITLMSLGGQIVQGYLYSKPISATEVGLFLESPLTTAQQS
ncbi:putative bifunctional diguanylate cyclase/phosphodiesterase [Caballeronia sordidicola]|uniref:Diguanylate cyclase/phosphodiesterase (GGDEF & EAL protein) with PAS/PAC sensor(S) n=1 Tax=Caballeronia sordidicola TaxID=196367 RepID=A0A242MW30_CABSO|nr:EAL domain-containing protein [Caballeronia sordidicola]OTP75648.1 diguanylate cyclase/phosphodiesterase (GGDEF & EAL protein) with PAS/PAC sensor(s) [Caballeronia sordidicola]